MKIRFFILEVLLIASAFLFLFSPVFGVRRLAPQERVLKERKNPNEELTPTSDVDEARVDPSILARYFRMPQVDETSVINPIEPEEEKNTALSVQLKKSKQLGTVADVDGIEWLYVKDTETGEIFRARLDGKETDGIRFSQDGENRSIVMDGQVYQITGDN